MVPPNPPDPFCFPYTNYNCLPLLSKWPPYEPKNWIPWLLIPTRKRKTSRISMTTLAQSIRIFRSSKTNVPTSNTSNTWKPPLNTSWVVPRTLPLMNNHLIRMTMTLPITKVLILPTFLETSTLPKLRWKNLMDRILQAGSPKWNIISLCMALLMI